jgi:hypothetical protein
MSASELDDWVRSYCATVWISGLRAGSTLVAAEVYVLSGT